MLLSAAIAAFGLVNDSAAVVIGAMLVAPLMTPILAVAAAVTQGWARRALESLLIVAAGALVGIAVGIAVGLLMPSLHTGLPLPGEILRVAERTAPVLPGNAGAGGMSGPWVWCAPTLSHLPGHAQPRRRTTTPCRNVHVFCRSIHGRRRDPVLCSRMRTTPASDCVQGKQLMLPNLIS